MMFYGGIAGMGLALAAGLVALLVLSRDKARLTKKLDEEYGKREG